MENNPKQIGIMGGAFNPFHNGHLRHAIEVLERMNLSHVELLPSANHPHKKKLLPFELRVQCIEESVKDIDFLSVNTMEKDIVGPSYTHVILQAWQEANPHSRPYFMMGAEDFAQLPTWHRGFELPELTHLLIVSRHGASAYGVCQYAQEYWKDVQVIDQITGNTQSICSIQPHTQYERVDLLLPHNQRCTYLHVPLLNITATQIRALWREEKALNGIVPEAVNSFIQNNGKKLKPYWSTEN